MTASTAGAPDPGVAALFRDHQRALFGLAYRVTGCAADADEIVQETFARALARPPARRDAPMAPWLVRVATNLAIDVLRRRRRQGAGEPWLPSPIDVADDALPLAASGPLHDARYEQLESVTFAFLLALEALTPRQRAALVLCDVCGYSAAEAARALRASEASVRVLHHRARRALADYDRARCRPDAALAARTRAALEALIQRLLAGDVAGLEALLCADVRTVTDAGGEFNALRGERVGRTGVLRFHLRVAQRRGLGARIAPCVVNGLPALALTFVSATPRQAPHVLMRCEVDEQGRIRAIHSVLATRKLSRVRFPA
jgi:RNA polymerase sigma-70 factor (ECF subfamily)